MGRLENCFLDAPFFITDAAYLTYSSRECLGVRCSSAFRAIPEYGYVIFITAGITIGNRMINKTIPKMTANAIWINVMTPDGINAANVPLKMIPAEMTTVPITVVACNILSLVAPGSWRYSRYFRIRKIE